MVLKKRIQYITRWFHDLLRCIRSIRDTHCAPIESVVYSQQRFISALTQWAVCHRDLLSEKQVRRYLALPVQFRIHSS